MVSLTQSYSFTSQSDSLSSSQWEQNLRSDAENGVRRVTVRQLLKATTTGDSDSINHFQIDGVDIKRVMLVANVCDERETPAGKSYDFDDGTGRIRGSGWGKNPGFTFEQFAYARVVGELEQYKGSTTLKVINIQPVFQSHEVYFHLLHAIFETLKLDGRPTVPPPNPLSQSQNHYVEVPTTPNSPVDQVDSLSQVFEHVSLSSSEVTMPSTPRRPQLRSKLERDIVSFILGYTDDDDDTIGVPIEDIVDHIASTNPDVDSRTASNAMEYLLLEDFIATAGDEEHYQPGAHFRI